jgi:Na+-translocating ferredoxin:NAD+ oxidoreductase RnfG subunit
VNRFVGGSLRGKLLHAGRVALFAAIILLIHNQHWRTAGTSTGGSPLDPTDVAHFFPETDSVAADPADRSSIVYDQLGNELGRVLQTSPASDSVIGFSGPTNTLIALNADGKICGLSVYSSQDTRDHIRQVKTDSRFLSALNGKTQAEAIRTKDIDAVSGATLSSLAILEGIHLRLGGAEESLKFTDNLTVRDIQPLFADAHTIEQDANISYRWRVRDIGQVEVGLVLRTSPSADNLVGYQGPTETLVGVSPEGNIVGIVVGKSYDNLPYVDYVRDDNYFKSMFSDLRLNELAELDLKAAGVEGVSGATMTSRAVAEGLIVAAHSYQEDVRANSVTASLWSALSVHDLGTAAVIIAGVLIGMTSLRSNKSLRIGFQLLLIVYLGLTVGNLVSQAMLVGWAQHGVPWQSAAGLAMLSIAAFALPIVTRRNLYCTHLCPHGAAQQLLKRRSAMQIRLPRQAKVLLHLIPALLLAWCIVVGMTSLGFSLVDVEAFDAYVFRIAGVATITIAIVGLVASVFVPMAYCRYGCPTGALLNFLRLNAHSDRWTVRDWLAVSYLLLALGLWAG